MHIGRVSAVATRPIEGALRRRLLRLPPPSQIWVGAPAANSKLEGVIGPFHSPQTIIRNRGGLKMRCMDPGGDAIYLNCCTSLGLVEVR